MTETSRRVVVTGIGGLSAIGNTIPDIWQAAITGTSGIAPITRFDASDYGLPPAYGPYRWVRYFDDVMLVDVRSGIVADILYDFFWR